MGFLLSTETPEGIYLLQKPYFLILKVLLKKYIIHPTTPTNTILVDSGT